MAECEWGEDNELDSLGEEARGIKDKLDIFESGDLVNDGASL